MKALVTGGAGFMGKHLVRKLIEQGDSVRCLVRRTSRKAPLAEMGAALADGDITHYESVLEAAKGIDIVYHAAALVGMGRSRTEFYLANVEGTRNVLKACETAGIGRLVYVSTQSVTFDFTDKYNADETTPYPPRYKDHYSETKALAEREVLEAAKSGRVSAVAVRPTWVWGPGDTTIMPIMAKLAHRRQLFLIGGGRAETSTSYVENVCDCLILAGRNMKISGEAFFVTDDERITAREFITKMADAAGFPHPKISIPYSVAYASAAVAEKLHSLTSSKSEPLMTRYGIALTGRNLTFSCEKAKSMLGYRPAVTIDEGMRRLSNWVHLSGGARNPGI
ncbi:MAG: NAD-dependent epimerase/dehydratase family protein [Candidatus Abyssobacteria bacterium SURF_5]|uniref:NAD-dependent epimerase/dehydratase family protein n=1 Tax=Abyssobacteria bacterium (strain SURF_5) TaxID=2093360 RepID=A0A3A4P3G5_ABYX5|nr:MAG: NAD-dependent epimerase/dehydratase family protein [Candidatus Abyssubacteria bacterium SURF_5]